MGTYRFGKWQTWDGYHYYSIDKKNFWGVWKEVKTWGIGYVYEDYTEGFERNQKRKMIEAVVRLTKAGHTVI